MGRYANFEVKFDEGEVGECYKFHFGLQAGVDLLCMGGVHWTSEDSDSEEYADFNVDVDAINLDCFEKNTGWINYLRDFMTRIHAHVLDRSEHPTGGEPLTDLYYEWFYGEGQEGQMGLDKKYLEEIHKDIEENGSEMDWPEVSETAPVLCPDFNVMEHITTMRVEELGALMDLYTIFRAYKELGATEIFGGFECH